MDRHIDWLTVSRKVTSTSTLKQDRKFQTATFRQEVISGRKSHKGTGFVQ
jgi:hypothetical protein